MRRLRRLPSYALIALLAIATFLPVTTPAAGNRSGELALALVGIDRIGPDRLDALKANPAIEWWVEIDREMLVAGPRKALVAAFSRHDGFRLLEGAVDTSEIYFTKRYGADDFKRVGARLLVTDGTASIIVATPEQIALLGSGHAAEHGVDDGCRGHATIVPFEPNAMLAHQAANSRVSAPLYDVSVQAMVDSVDGNRWFADNQQLSTYNRYSRGSGIIQARDWLVDQFEALPGLTVTTQAFTVPANTTAYNVIATIQGTTRPNDWYIVGAHYDSISNNDGHATAPGAEDNGSGTAGVLELARIFTENPPEATMLFICYAGEEQGLYGSAAHAQSLVNSGDSAKVRGMFNMDMIGYTGDSDLDCLIETRSLGAGLRDALVSAAATYTTLRIVTSSNPCCSDHMPYLDRNMPAVLSIENDYGSYPGYHRSSDLSSQLTITMAVEIMKMNVAAIAQMAGTVPAGLGDDTIGVFNPATATFFLRNSNTPGPADAAFGYGPANVGFKPLAGDWNGDGVDTVGLYDPATGNFFLKNSNAAGPADLVFSFGAGGAGYVPLAGDWNGDGIDTIGIYQPSSGGFFLRNANSSGPADLVFSYGPAGATPLAGDFDGDGITTVGVYVPSTGAWFLRNSNAAGSADLVFTYGAANSGMLPLVGDWNNDRAQTVGLYDPATGSWFLRNSNSAGPGAVVFGYGPVGMAPVLGDWNGQ